jgi:outer membrane protein assembly factor BamA
MQSFGILLSHPERQLFKQWLRHSIYSGFRLLASGFFFSLLVFPLPAQSQKARIGSLQFQGNRLFSSDQLLRRMPAGREGAFYDPEAFQAQLKDLEDRYHEEGYLEATVGPPAVHMQSADEVSIAAITVPISEGRLFSVGEIHIRDARVFDASTMQQMCPLSRGKPYQRRKLNDWVEKLKESYHEMGYIRFEVSTLEERDDDRKIVNLTLNCREGEAYTIVKIAVEGNPSVNTSEFKRRLLMSEGSVFNPDMISTSLFYINQMKIYGSISASDVEIHIDDARHTVDLIFRLPVPK